MQALVIGLGRFGVSVARSLMERGVEVLAVDHSEDRVRAIAPDVTEAVILDATDAEALGRTAPERRDLCVCAIGDDSIQASILCTTLLREMGARRIVSRASDDLQARILRRVGAHEVVDPLRDFGVRFASHLLHEEILGEMAVGRDLNITEMRVTEWMAGKSLSELDLQQRGGITVIGIRDSESGLAPPDPNRALSQSDTLIVASRPGAVESWMEEGEE